MLSLLDRCLFVFNYYLCIFRSKSIAQKKMIIINNENLHCSLKAHKCHIYCLVRAILFPDSPFLYYFFVLIFFLSLIFCELAFHPIIIKKGDVLFIPSLLFDGLCEPSFIDLHVHTNWHYLFCGGRGQFTLLIKMWCFQIYLSHTKILKRKNKIQQKNIYFKKNAWSSFTTLVFTRTENRLSHIFLSMS